MDKHKVTTELLKFLSKYNLIETFSRAIRDYGFKYKNPSIIGYVSYHLDDGRPVQDLIRLAFRWFRVNGVAWDRIDRAWINLCHNKSLIHLEEQQPSNFKSIW